jgi:hypothetical protein
MIDNLCRNESQTLIVNAILQRRNPIDSMTVGTPSDMTMMTRAIPHPTSARGACARGGGGYNQKRDFRGTVIDVDDHHACCQGGR